jgi:hypothetical protein
MEPSGRHPRSLVQIGRLYLNAKNLARGPDGTKG